ncbi:MAG TPA: hypothetical protein ENL20_01515 [Candidatus Cloacimonetes bacterium]|nr:hypothetical protein [Candidatus Cloacimonadota bacterium]
MKKYIIAFLIIISIFFVSFAEEIESDEFGKEIYTEEDDIFKIEYTKKSAAKAMLLSALFPGAGNFYANPKSITTYIFPLIEIGLWYGYIHYNKMGDDKTEEYEYYATGEVIGYDDEYPNGVIHRYNRFDQERAEELLISYNDNDHYDEDYFQLDDDNSQHFYEDIGKYDKYLFGWYDWINIYATQIDQQNQEFFNINNDKWIFDSGNWIGNNPMNLNSGYYINNKSEYDSHNGKYSIFRAEYIEMRKDAENFYGNAVSCNFGIVFNHILSSLDALRLARNRNVEYTDNRLKIKVAPVFVNNELSPSIMLSKRF